MSEDEKFMRRALLLAERGRGFVEPNPLVGAIVVRDGAIVGEGHHERFGGAHAEVNALAQAGSAARGATLYVTLEPCCHYGKTPPCTDAVIAAGISRVPSATIVSSMSAEKARSARPTRPDCQPTAQRVVLRDWTEVMRRRQLYPVTVTENSHPASS